MGGLSARLGVGLQVVAATLLAVLAALLAVEVAERRYLRFDLSASGRNTLDPALVALVERAPGGVRVDVLFQPLQPPYDAVAAAAQERTLAALQLLATAHRDAAEVVLHDPAEPAAFAAARRELGATGENQLVVTVGERRAVLDLFGDVAEVDWGNPTAEQLRYLAERGLRPTPSFGPAAPPRLLAAHPLEALARGIVAAGSGERLRAVFTTGAGEPGLASTLTDGLAALAAALARAGFDVEPWDPARGPVPAGTAVVAAVAPHRPWRADERARLEEHLARGGRLLAAVDLDAAPDPGAAPVEGTLAALLARHGVAVLPGAVSMPIRGPGGALVEGDDAVAELVIGARGLSHEHPVTEPLARVDRRVVVAFAPALELRPQPEGGVVAPLVVTPPDLDAWRDLAPDRVLDPAHEPTGRRVPLAAAVRWPGGGPGGERHGLDGAPEDAPAPGAEARLVVLPASLLGNAYLGNVDANRDLARNAFAWLAGREARVAVEVRPPGVARFDLAREGAVAALSWTVAAGLPGAALATALVVAWRRRR